VPFDRLNVNLRQQKKILWKAGKWITKMCKPFATEILQHESQKPHKGKKNNPKITWNFWVRFKD